MFVVNGIGWHIAYVRPYNPMLMRSDGSYSLGMTDNKKKTVFINDTLRGEMLERVISHEIVHCFCFSNDINLDEETEEIVADFLARYGRKVFDIADSILNKYIKVA